MTETEAEIWDIKAQIVDLMFQGGLLAGRKGMDSDEFRANEAVIKGLRERLVELTSIVDG